MHPAAGALARTLPDGRRRTVARQGHDLAPEALAPVLEEFLLDEHARRIPDEAGSISVVLRHQCSTGRREAPDPESVLLCRGRSAIGKDTSPNPGLRPLLYRRRSSSAGAGERMAVTSGLSHRSGATVLCGRRQPGGSGCASTRSTWARSSCSSARTTNRGRTAKPSLDITVPVWRSSPCRCGDASTWNRGQARADAQCDEFAISPPTRVNCLTNDARRIEFRAADSRLAWALRLLSTPRAMPAVSSVAMLNFGTSRRSRCMQW